MRCVLQAPRAAAPAYRQRQGVAQGRSLRLVVKAGLLDFFNPAAGSNKAPAVSQRAAEAAEELLQLVVPSGAGTKASSERREQIEELVRWCHAWPAWRAVDQGAWVRGRAAQASLGCMLRWPAHTRRAHMGTPSGHSASKQQPAATLFLFLSHLDVVAMGSCTHQLPHLYSAVKKHLLQGQTHPQPSQSVVPSWHSTVCLMAHPLPLSATQRRTSLLSSPHLCRPKS